MTGYASSTGSVTLAGSTWQVRAEVRSVNSRFLELKTKHSLGAEFEDAIRRLVESKVSRGRVDVALHTGSMSAGSEGAPPGASDGIVSLAGWQPDPQAIRSLARAIAATQAEARLEQVELTTPNALECLRFLRSLSAETAAGSRDAIRGIGGLNGGLNGSALAANGESSNEALAGGGGLREHRQQLWEIHRATLSEALDALVLDREREGAGLRDKLGELLADLRAHVAALAELARVEPERIFERARQRLHSLSQAVDLPGQDHMRLLQEVAVVVTKADVAEEVARLELHMDHLAERLDSEAPGGVGKSLDFLAQELMRECTTLGAKLSHPDAGRLVIDAKGCVERIREQVQNVE